MTISSQSNILGTVQLFTSTTYSFYLLTLAYSDGQIRVASSAYSIGLLPLSHLMLIHLIWPLYSTLFVGICLLGLIQMVQFVRRSFQHFFLLAWPDILLLGHRF